MKFVAVNELPTHDDKPAEYHNYTKEFERFMKKNCKFAKVEFEDGEYKNLLSSYPSIKYAIQRRALPIDIRCINGDIYLVRRDI